jgi:Triosephosphate isomerase
MKAVIDCKNLKWNDIIIAYEPVWAIGTGKVPPISAASRTAIRNTSSARKNYVDRSIPKAKINRSFS